MKFHPTTLPGVTRIEFEPREDERGYFMRLFCEDEIRDAGLGEFHIRQINRSLTREKGFLRGMHIQLAPRGEGKIVQCVRGAVFDVAIDLRPESETYCRWVGVELREGENTALFIPRGFAHGFVTLTENCEMLYCMDEFYSPEHASGVRWNDSAFAIEWPSGFDDPQMNERDAQWPLIQR